MVARGRYSAAGLSYEGPNGIISGTPKQFGTYAFTFQATDSSSTPETATVALTMTVNAGLAVNPATLPQGQTGTPYSQTIAVTGGLAALYPDDSRQYAARRAQL